MYFVIAILLLSGILPKKLIDVYMNHLFLLLYRFLDIGLQTYQYLIILTVISSFFGGLPRNKIGYFIYDVTTPIISLMRRIPYQFGGFDFSSYYALLLLYEIQKLLPYLFAGIMG